MVNEDIKVCSKHSFVPFSSDRRFCVIPDESVMSAVQTDPSGELWDKMW